MRGARACILRRGRRGRVLSPLHELLVVHLVLGLLHPLAVPEALESDRVHLHVPANVPHGAACRAGVKGGGRGEGVQVCGGHFVGRGGQGGLEGVEEGSGGGGGGEGSGCGAEGGRAPPGGYVIVLLGLRFVGCVCKDGS